MNICQCNPFVRAAMIQPAILEGNGFRYAYDHRVFFVLENEGVLITEEGESELSADDLVFIPPSVGYYFRGRIKVAVLNFDMGRLCEKRKDPICPPPIELFQKELLFMDERVDGLDGVHIIHTDAIWRSKVTEIVEVFDAYDDVKDAQSSAMLKSLLALLYQRLYSPKENEGLLARKVESYIRLNSAQISSNNDLADIFGYHPVYLSELYKKQFGISLHKAIVLSRIELACRWLMQTDQSVEEIAFATGFSSRNHFCTAFRREKGITPHKYRKASRT